MVKGLVIFSLVCACWTKFAPDTAPKVAKEDIDMAGIKAKKWVSKKLVEEKKWYDLLLNDEGTFLTTLRIPTFDRIALENKQVVIFKDEKSGEHYVGYRLFLSKEEALIFRTTYKNYIELFEPVEDNSNKETRSIIWK